MGSMKKRKHGTRNQDRVSQHKISVLGISGVIVMLIVVLSVASISLHEKNQNYKEQEAKLEAQLEEQKARSEEIDELEEYVGTDEYIEDVAKEKLGLINPNEILFKAEP
ncbi:MAG: septum formation initiator family protein [Tyzzerella sp.]|nr:septum formation initiator family protein [Tyzzerella sp.]